MQGLEVIRVGLQVHLAQEFVLQDSVVPDLGGDKVWGGGGIFKSRSIGLWGAGGRALNPFLAVQALAKRSPALPLPHREPWARPSPSGASGFLPSVKLPSIYSLVCYY